MFYKLVTGAFGQRAQFYVKTKTQNPFRGMRGFYTTLPHRSLSTGWLGKEARRSQAMSFVPFSSGCCFTRGSWGHLTGERVATLSGISYGRNTRGNRRPLPGVGAEGGGCLVAALACLARALSAWTDFWISAMHRLFGIIPTLERANKQAVPLCHSRTQIDAAPLLPRMPTGRSTKKH